MSIFIGYIFLGLSLAAPIGPVNAAQLDKGIKSGFFHAWLVGLGAMIADIIYMLAVFLGIVHFLEIPFMKAFLWSFGFFVLVYTGIESLISAGKIVSSTRNNEESAIKSFFSGFFMSISNPLTILFWLGIYGSVLAETATKYNQTQVAIYSLAIIIGLLLWDITMAGVSSSFRRFLSMKVLTAISMLSGLSLIGFGFYFGYQALILIFPI
ncbi:LysE family transporter [Cytobacillus solani]|uniref:Amino acid transporter n=1 Tax=Cytobacillus solani TaxID=1637975 RepID=A0A0Q3QQR0_9BACI|nr:LysE family transporter [Cytobacillus solani]KOP83030.1 amino acid transporter [Bacillus sp. FJAT-21945]KQL20054.1 amino acid transporter [Cytobacillus solani]USK53306.1 LysE family translocator [Cytobacillus solani]